MSPWYEHKKRTGSMLCYPFEAARLQGSSRKAWNNFPVGTQTKLDGERCRREVESGLLLSSTEELIYSVPHIQDGLNKLNPPFELDGELYLHNLCFEEIHSIVSRTKNLHPDHKSMEFHVFDIASDDPNDIQAIRSRKLFNWFDAYVDPAGPIKLVSLDIAKNQAEVLTNYDRYVANGFEGVIIRHLWKPYLRRRSTFVMKFKPKKKDDYKIVGFTEEHDKFGNPKNRLGSVTVVDDNGYTFDVYSGFDDSLRDFLWSVRHSELVGKVITVHYQNLTAANNVPHFGRVDKRELKTIWEIS